MTGKALDAAGTRTEISSMPFPVMSSASPAASTASDVIYPRENVTSSGSSATSPSLDATVPGVCATVQALRAMSWLSGAASAPLPFVSYATDSASSTYLQPSVLQTYCTPAFLVTFSSRKGAPQSGQGLSTGFFQSENLQSG